MQEKNQQEKSTDPFKLSWDNKAKFYQEDLEQITFPSAVTLGNMLEISKAKNIVEMACATGLYSLYFLKTFNNAETFLSIDFSDKMIELANETKSQTEGLCKTTKHEFIVGSAEDLSFIKEESQDIYFSNLCVPLLLNPTKTLQEAKRILRKDGKIGITVPYLEKGSLIELFVSTFKEFSKDPPPSISFFTRETLIKTFQENGFEVVYCWEESFRLPVFDEAGIDGMLAGEDQGPAFRKFDAETQKVIRAKILEGFEKMRQDLIAPYMKILSIVAKKL